MKNIFLLVAGFAMCGTVAASPTYGVIENVVVIDVGESVVGLQAIALEYNFVAPAFFDVAVGALGGDCDAESVICIGSGLEDTNLSFTALAVRTDHERSKLLERLHNEQRHYRSLASGNLNYPSFLPNSRRARDGLSC